MSDQRFLVLVLDGLRPDLVTPEIMPNLAAFRDQAAVLRNSRAQYPTHTRVNKVSFATGAPPAGHGIHFNKIFDPALNPDAVIDLGEYADVRGADSRSDLITASTIGQILAGAGRKFTLLYCGMSGAPWLLNYRADTVGQEHLSLGGYQYSTPAMAKGVEAKLGAMPASGGVDFERTRFAFAALTAFVEPEFKPDVTLIWSDEPDKSLHVDGLTGPDAMAALSHADSLVALAVAHWRATEGLNLVILSDHGHVETSARAPIGAILAGSGLPVTTDPAQKGALLLPFGSGGLYLRGLGEDALDDIVDFMQRQDWCGTLFTGDGPDGEGLIAGTFSKALASLDHARAPDLLFTLRRMDGNGERRFGHCVDAGDKTISGSTHGGLHREELATVAFAAGPAFKQAYISETPGGMIDIVPTILHVFGIDRPKSMVGRPLLDLLAGGGRTEDAEISLEAMTMRRGDYSQSVQFRRLRGRTIMEHGERHISA
jgi:hypothetical protein